MKRMKSSTETSAVAAPSTETGGRERRGGRGEQDSQYRGPWGRRLRDQITDVAVELSSRLSRTILMISAVAFSTGALLASVGISQNAAHQIDADIAASAANLVMVTVPERESSGAQLQAAGPSESPESESAAPENAADQATEGQSADAGSESPETENAEERGSEEEAVESASTEESGAGSAVRTTLPDDTEERLEEIDTVDVVGRRLDVDQSGDVVVDRPAIGAQMVRVGVKGASSGYLEAASIEHTGEHQWMLDGGENVAFLRPLAAERLGIPVTDDTRNLSVEINNTEYSIIGFLPGEHAFSESVVIPYTNALQIVGNDNYSQVLIRTALGAGSQVSSVARLAILPGTPEKLAVSQVISPNTIRENVSSQLTRQATWVGAFLIVLTVLLITNSMIVSVTARTTEIGVRRALGASRSSVAGVFWCEGALIGALGGLAGAALAAIMVTAIAAVNGWTAYLNPLWISLGPVLGMTVGLVASAYPAMRAATIHPAIAVRSD